MMEELIPIVLFIAFGYVIKVMSDNSVKKRLIEKGLVDENLKYLFAEKKANNTPSSLKWGMVLTAVGLAIFLGTTWVRGSEEIIVALMFIFGGIALVIYYFIASHANKKQEPGTE